MTKVAVVAPTPDLVDRFSAAVTPVTKVTNSSVRWNGRLIPPRKKYKYTTKSLLPQIAELWLALSSDDKAAWAAAGAAASYNPWNTFVQDTAYRLKFGISGLATPSTLHSYKCGEIIISSPATHFEITQEHPIEYFKMKKVKGTKSQFVPVAVDEVLALPLDVQLSYRSNLTAVGPAPKVRFYATVYYAYQGLDHPQEVGFDIPLVSGWARSGATLSSVVSFARWYTLHIELVDVQGVLQFDLVQAKHSGTNFARDFRCNNIAAGFTNANYQLPASWTQTAVVTGASFGSVYPDDGAL